ncbi:DUF6479 family protein [Streptomyces montanus]|nr:DUF6479 family protein [Streptomyces montanus]
MDTVTTHMTLSSPVLGGVVPFLVGIVIVGALIAAVWWGHRLREREPAPPHPHEQPRPPASGPVREVRERREPVEVPRGRQRLTPHQLWGHVGGGSRPAMDQEAPTWDKKGSGASGSGGPGRT